MVEALNSQSLSPSPSSKLPNPCVTLDGNKFPTL
ncbi:hypothetical protein A2U01_0062061, partial [Trifolium medium]|nr:hypothetical protein [Trifolium medium]